MDAFLDLRYRSWWFNKSVSAGEILRNERFRHAGSDGKFSVGLKGKPAFIKVCISLWETFHQIPFF
jgi:hypothetical protein